MAPDGTAPHLMLDLGFFDAICVRRGLVTQADRARALRMSRQTINNIESGKTQASPQFIAAVLDLFPDRHFEDFFVTPRQDAERTAARTRRVS